MGYSRPIRVPAITEGKRWHPECVSGNAKGIRSARLANERNGAKIYWVVGSVKRTVVPAPSTKGMYKP